MNTEVKIAGVMLKNPVMTASGTFGSGMEYSDFVDLNGRDERRGECAVAGEPHPQGGGDLRGDVECDRTAESGDRCLSGAGYPFFRAV